MSKRKKKLRNMEEDEVLSQPGEKLRRAREAHELSVNNVAVRLKLSVEKIHALERGDIEGLAAPVFVAGYLRTYARLLGLSEAEVLEDFVELLRPKELVVDPALTTNDAAYGTIANGISSQFSLRSKSSGSRWGAIGFSGALVLVLVYLLWPTNEVVRTKVADTENMAEEHAAPVLEIVDITGNATVDKTGMVDAELAEETHSSVVEFSTETAINEMVSTDIEEIPEVALEPVAAGMKSELALSFNSDSWAEVKDARGQRLVYRLGKSGSTRIVTGLAPFMVQLGFVQGVDILYNGTIYDLSKYANRRSVRLYIGQTGDHLADE